MWTGCWMATSSLLSAPICVCGEERSKTRSWAKPGVRKTRSNQECDIMSRMIDLIRASAVPSILVHLAVHNKIFGQQAQLTLAGWDEAASRAAAGDPSTPKEVLNYLISPANLRPVLLPSLLVNPSVSAEALLELAPGAGREVVEVMLKSERVTGSPVILDALLSNPHLTGIQGETIRNLIQPAAPAPTVTAPSTPKIKPAPAGAAEVALEQ